MLSNAFFLAKFRFDTAENEPAKNLQKFANFANFANPNPAPCGVAQLVAPHRDRCRPPSWQSSQAGAARWPRIALGRMQTRTRRVVAGFWQNFSKMLLVFGCIGADLCKKIRVLQHFSNLPDYLAENFEIWQHFVDFATFATFATFANFLLNFHEFSRKLLIFQTDVLRKF